MMPRFPEKKMTTAPDRKSTSMDEPPPAVPWPSIPMKAYGWPSSVLGHSEITTRKIYEMYRLDDEDLAGLKREKRASDKDVYYLVFLEYEVELRAWMKHGGPVGFWYFLKSVQEDLARPQSIQKPFSPPESYRLGRPYALTRNTPPSPSEVYERGFPAMHAVKNELPDWFWMVCNMIMNDLLEEGKLPTVIRPERVVAMQCALRFFHQHSYYAGRPEKPLATGKSLSLNILRAILRVAPSVPEQISEWSDPVKGLEFRESGTEEPDYYQWDTKYRDRIFNALSRLIKEAGTGDSGWGSVRWEVYYKCADALYMGLEYYEETTRWIDLAGIWLEGRVSGLDELQRTLRTSPAGVKYNDLLPWLPAGPVKATAIPSMPHAGPSSLRG